MSRLEWAPEEGRIYKSGVEQGALYFDGGAVVWNGLVSITESPIDDDISVAYFDGQKYSQSRSIQGLSLSLEAYTYPDELLERKGPFGLTYKVLNDSGYELHIIYGAKLGDRETSYVSVDTSLTPALFKFEMATKPTIFDQNRATSHIIIDPSDAHPDVIIWLESKLYGTDTEDPYFPTLDEIVSAFHLNSAFTVRDNGDGTCTMIGPVEYIQEVDLTTFKITTPSIDFIDANTYKIRSW